MRPSCRVWGCGGGLGGGNLYGWEIEPADSGAGSQFSLEPSANGPRDDLEFLNLSLPKIAAVVSQEQ